MLLFARLLGEVFTKLKQPAVIGEILAGIILGPTVIGTFFPDISNYIFPDSQNIKTALSGITSIAVTMLLLVSGLEVDLSVILRQSKSAFLTSIMGIIFPFTIGFLVAYLSPNFFGIKDENQLLIFALFIGTAMAISALPVIARTLMDLNIFRTEIGLIIIASAMFDDLTGWLIFSVILGSVGAEAAGLGFSERIIITISFVLIMLLFVRKIINKIFPFVQNKFSYPGSVLNLIFILGFLCAAFTEAIGIHAIFGAFIVGVTIGDSTHLRVRTREIIHQFITNIFAPLFFVSIGLRVNFVTNFELGLVSLVILIAFIGKVGGCSLGAYWGGMNRNDALAVGFGMNSRGAMEIILGLLALQYGLIQEKVFVALVIMALFTSLASAPIMSYFIRGLRKISFESFLDPQLVIFSSQQDKTGVITELVDIVCNKHHLDKNNILDEILSREQQTSTGISNYLAIPHARVNINKPIIAIALHKDGIDFSAFDKLPSKIIMLLLTPLKKHELQLQLLADIAGRFKEKDKVEERIKAASINEFLFKLRVD